MELIEVIVCGRWRTGHRGVGAEVLSKRPAVGSALQSSISGTEMEGDRERK